MSKVYIALQSPVIELQVKAKTADGQTANMQIGYKRYDMDESQNKMNSYQELAKQMESTVDVNGKEVPVDAATISRVMAEINEFLINEITYIKGATLLLEADDGTLVERTIKDTRQVKDDETLWGPASESVRFLLQLALKSPPWRVSLLSGWFKAIFNTDLSEQRTGN